MKYNENKIQHCHPEHRPQHPHPPHMKTACSQSSRPELSMALMPGPVSQAFLRVTISSSASLYKVHPTQNQIQIQGNWNLKHTFALGPPTNME